MEITSTTQEGITTLALEGRLDTITASDLEHAINSRIDGGDRKILLNFAKTSYISSGGMRVLLATAKKLRNDGDRFGLCNLTPEVHKVLKLAGFTSLFSIYASEAEARAGMQ